MPVCRKASFAYPLRTAFMKRFGQLTSRSGAARVLLLVQLLATVGALGWVPGNLAKLAVMLLVWPIGFGRIAASELAAMAAVNLLFVTMNQAALKRGIFAFSHPDFLGMPIYEYLMWGFYTLHTVRFVNGAAPHGRRIAAVVAAVLFAAPFATIAEPGLLLLVSAAALAAAVAVFHQRMDLAYAAYMATLGAMIEYVGVSTGQWHYPGQHYGGVPLWSLTMWAGVGLFTRRLVVPLLQRRGHDPAGVC
jgi:hypothetical protein